MKIALLSCTKSKRPFRCEAWQMYSASTNFRHAYKYAKLTCDKVYILSAKYGLLEETDVIDPYEETLKTKTREERQIWARKILIRLSEECSLDHDEYVILTGRMYHEFLLPFFKNYELPLKGLGIDYWVPELERLIHQANHETYGHVTERGDQNPIKAGSRHTATILHEAVNRLPRYKWSDINTIPFRNGIYLIFEQGETYRGMDRIVRVGTHTSDGNLINRLRNHYINENKDGSIFRKNVGLALLHKRRDPYESTWNKNTSLPAICQALGAELNWPYKMLIEKDVSLYLRNNTSFSCFPVESKMDRLRIEDGIIATLNQCLDFRGSNDWLGKDNPKSLIQSSGLWNIEGLAGSPLTESELRDLTEQIKYIPSAGVTFPGGKTHGMPVPKAGISNLDRPGAILSPPAQATPNQFGQKPFSLDLPLSQRIQDHIEKYLNAQKRLGKTEAILIARDIHREMHLEDKMPSVCLAMRKAMTKGDEVLFETPSGYSSTLKIRYWLK